MHIEVCASLLRVLYQSVVNGAIFYTGVCWGNRLSGKATLKPNKLIMKAKFAK